MAIVSLAFGKTVRGWIIVSAILFTSLAVADKPLSTVADLRYGATLYEYYLGDFFQALSELMVAEQRGGIQGHGDNPALIEGGISLSFGMERKAGDIFAELLAADTEGKFNRPLEVRNAAWFYLGKLRYLRGDWDGTEESFSRISGRFDPDLLQELEALVINLAIRRDNLDGAIQNLGKARNVQDWLPYLYYNLGNAYARQQNFAEAVKYYQRLADIPISLEPVQREEQLVLYDRAFTAAGYSYILQGQQQEAINQFTKVRLDSPFANRALLGYGWAAAENEQYELALKPWQELSKRSLVFASTQEAVIAVPFAYEQMGAKGQALQEYLSAELSFQKEIVRIESVQAELDQLDLLAALDIDETEERNWFNLNEDAVARPNLSYLTELFSLNQFQGSVQELRDLMNMRDKLTVWRDKIDAYAYMLDQREINRENEMREIAARNLGQQLATMQARRDALDAYLRKIVDANDYLALAEGDQKEFAEIVLNMERTVNAMRRAGQSVTQYEEQVRRYKGLLLWEGSENFTNQQWQVRRVINELDHALEDANNNLNRLNRAVVEAPDIAPYRERMASLNQRLEYETGRVQSAVTLAENRLRGQVSEELANQRGRLQHYQSQARLSVARLYDSALQIRGVSE
jgi:tetratricopeptide (TPR) repeat protein